MRRPREAAPLVSAVSAWMVFRLRCCRPAGSARRPTRARARALMTEVRPQKDYALQCSRREATFAMDAGSFALVLRESVPSRCDFKCDGRLGRGRGLRTWTSSATVHGPGMKFEAHRGCPKKWAALAPPIPSLAYAPTTTTHPHLTQHLIEHFTPPSTPRLPSPRATAHHGAALPRAASLDGGPTAPPVRHTLPHHSHRTGTGTDTGTGTGTGTYLHLPALETHTHP
jgi:hypothetical protein